MEQIVPVEHSWTITIEAIITDENPSDKYSQTAIKVN